MNSFSKVITLDGEAASGKTSVGQRLSKKLGYSFFDSGSIYRSLSWFLLDQKVEFLPREVFLALQHFHPAISDQGLISINERVINRLLFHDEINKLTPVIAGAFLSVSEFAKYRDNIALIVTAKWW